MTAKIYTSYLFLKYAAFSEEKKRTADIYFEREMPEIEKNYEMVVSGSRGAIDQFSDLLLEENT